MSVFSNPNSLTGGPYVMGIDFGTESCRVGIFDLTGAPVAFAATAYKTTHPAPGWAEQPMSIVGRTRWTTSSRPWPCGAAGQSATSEAGRA